MFPKLNCSSPQVINSYSFVMKCYSLLLQDATWVAMGKKHFEVYMALRCHFIVEELRLHDAWFIKSVIMSYCTCVQHIMTICLNIPGRVLWS